MSTSIATSQQLITATPTSGNCLLGGGGQLRRLAGPPNPGVAIEQDYDAASHRAPVGETKSPSASTLPARTSILPAFKYRNRLDFGQKFEIQGCIKFHVQANRGDPPVAAPPESAADFSSFRVRRSDEKPLQDAEHAAAPESL